MNGNQVGFYLSTASGGTPPQPDPFASRGGYRSSTTLYELESTLSANMTDRDLVVDTVSGADPGDGAWLLFVTGQNYRQARRIVDYDAGTDTYVLEEPVSNLGASGDYYRVFKPEAIFDDLDGVVCGAGQVDFRMVYGKNNGGAALSNRWTRVECLCGGSVGLEIAATYRDYGESAPHDYYSDVFTQPTLFSPWLGVAATNYIGRFSTPENFDEVYDQPPGSADNWVSDECSALWLRRIADPATREDGQAVYLVTFGFDDTGGDPDPLESSFLIVFDVAGFNAALAIEADRKPRINGGCRVKATVTVQETELAVPDVPIRWTIDGPGTLYAPENVDTDEDGQASCVYHSPTDQAEAGNTVTIEAAI